MCLSLRIFSFPYKMGKNDYVPLNQNIQKYNMQKNNTDQALSGLRITRPSLSQATELELNLLNNVHQISSNQSSLPITVRNPRYWKYRGFLPIGNIFVFFFPPFFSPLLFKRTTGPARTRALQRTPTRRKRRETNA